MKKYYVTTPLYYVNAAPHIGHAYTTLAADVVCRFRRMRGEEAFLLTGTDEHGAKIEEAARLARTTPQAYADGVAEQFKSLWAHLDVRYDDFLRTTETRHTRRVQGVFSRLLESGDIFKGLYQGYYCVSDETYWTETEAPESEGRRLCPNPECRKPLTLASEESYFFRLSRYQEPLLKLYRERPDFLKPDARANEILRFVESGLRDLAVSRSKISWGVPVPGDAAHVVYVWFDALLNYISAAGYAPEGAKEEGAPDFPSLWPADVHLVGKEIYRFHAVIWPAMLLALKLEPPRCVFAHGWWTVEGRKMSKSKGNFIDPRDITREFGVDAFRYFLFREMPFGNDGDFSAASLRRRYNAELANDLGNLLSRVVHMVDKYLGGDLPPRPPQERPPLIAALLKQSRAYESALERFALQEALNVAWAEIGKLNKHIDREAPWTKAQSDPEGLRALLFDLVWCLRALAGWIYPFMPETSAKMQSQLGVRRFPAPLTAHEVLSGSAENRISKGPPLFPRK